MTFAGRPRPTSRLSTFADTQAVVPPTPIASASRGRLRASARTADTGTVPKVPYCIGSQIDGKPAPGRSFTIRNAWTSVRDIGRRASAAAPTKVPTPRARPARSRVDQVICGPA